jgi:hypothetical protein
VYMYMHAYVHVCMYMSYTSYLQRNRVCVFVIIILYVNVCYL